MSWAFLGTRRKESIPLNIGINLNPKKCGPDATLESVQTLELADITKRVAVSVIYSIFDPLGLIAPLTIKYKLLLKEFNKVPNLGWSDPVRAELALQFKKLFEEMLSMDIIYFHRSVKPANTVGSPVSVALWDGAKSAFGAVLCCLQS